MRTLDICDFDFESMHFVELLNRRWQKVKRQSGRALIFDSVAGTALMECLAGVPVMGACAAEMASCLLTPGSNAACHGERSRL